MDEQQMKKSLEPFLVRKGDRDWRRAWYKYNIDLSGSITNERENEWLASQGAITIDKNKPYKGQISVIIKSGEKMSLYKILQDRLEQYLYNDNLKKIGSLVKN